MEVSKMRSAAVTDLADEQVLVWRADRLQGNLFRQQPKVQQRSRSKHLA